MVEHLAPDYVQDQGVKYGLKAKRFLLDVLVDDDFEYVGAKVADQVTKEQEQDYHFDLEKICE